MRKLGYCRKTLFSNITGRQNSCDIMHRNAALAEFNTNGCAANKEWGIKRYAALVAVFGLLASLAESVGAATQPVSEPVYKVGGFIYDNNYSAKLEEVPLQSNSGSLEITLTYGQPVGELKDLTIEPIRTTVGDFEKPYSIYTSGVITLPFNDINYAFNGWWQYYTGSDPEIWGVVSGGSTKDLSLPTSGNRTYCGGEVGWITPAGANVPLVSQQGGSMKIVVDWSSRTITSLSIDSVGKTTSTKGYAIESSGASTVMIATYGSSPTDLNGGGATVLVHFYGPDAPQISGTISGNKYYPSGISTTGTFMASFWAGLTGSC